LCAQGTTTVTVTAGCHEPSTWHPSCNSPWQEKLRKMKTFIIVGTTTLLAAAPLFAQENRGSGQDGWST
jgi:hypothetical protein